VIFNEEKLGSISPLHYAPISVDDDNEEEKSLNMYMDNKEENVHLENITNSTLKEKSSKSIEQKENTRELRPRDKLKPPKRYYTMYTEEEISKSYNEVENHPDRDKWVLAMKEELDAHDENKT